MNSTIPVVARLAHNIVRLSNFDNPDRPLFNTYQAALTPLTATAFDGFISLIARTYKIDDSSLKGLGDIYETSCRAVLMARAYDPLFNIARFQTQFLFAYVPSSWDRCRFAGAHPARFRAMLLLMSQVRAGHDAHSINEKDVDIGLKLVIGNELAIVDSALQETANSMSKIENVDEDVLIRNRNTVVDIVV